MNVWRKRTITFATFLAWVTKGLYLEALGPAMIDLKLIYNTNYESVTRAVAGRGAGGFLGAMIGAFLVDKYETHLELFMAVFTTIAGLCVAVVTQLPTIDHVWLLYCVIGGSSNVVNMAGTRLTLQIWKKKSAGVLQLMHMGFGVGALTGPLLCTPFLAVLKANDQRSGTQFIVLKESQANVAFTIIGFITVSVAIPFYVFFFTRVKSKGKTIATSEPVLVQPITNQTSLLKIINPATYADGNFIFGLCVFSFLAAYFFNIIGGEKVHCSFIRTIAVDKFKLPKAEASYLNSGFWVCLTIGRLIWSVVAHHVSVQKLILFQVFVHLISVVMNYSFALDSEALFWCLTFLEGFVVAPLYGLGIAYGDTQIKLTGFCLMIVTFSGSFGDMVYLWAGGRMYDVYGARAIFCLASIAGVGLVLSVVCFRSLSSKLKNR